MFTSSSAIEIQQYLLAASILQESMPDGALRMILAKVLMQFNSFLYLTLL